MSNKLWAVNILRYNTTLYTPFTDSVSAPIPHGGELIDKSCISRFNGEEIINNIPCYHVQVNKIPVARKEEKIKIIQSEYHYWISKADFVPVQYSTATGLVVDKDTTYNYEKLVLNKYEINNLQDEKFLTLQSIPVNYTTKDYVPGKKINLLAKDSLAPDWELLSVKNKKINLTALRGKLVLIDFFYKGCFPCILTFPALQSLHQKYRAKGLMVIGINPVDRKEDDIPSFLLKHGVTYPVLFSGQEIENDYHISGYPTLYLIDKNGRVIFSHCGYSKDLEKTLEKLIRKNL
jgi:thiol-disulfide isomerase/thioredoxin